MLPEAELRLVIEIAKKHGVEKLYLFGSSLREPPEQANDYDFAVLGLPSGRFFYFYSELLRALSKNVDLVDLSGKETKFKYLVMRDGKLVYDSKAA
ncbi:MAG: nucleotidyltransferase domain-containing protein [Armatimonadetes bacterium]|nr:nucleotidyltransferase domain-containing protein [Armatimonadota bacterium]